HRKRSESLSNTIGRRTSERLLPRSSDAGGRSKVPASTMGVGVEAMLDFNGEKVRENVRQAATDDLLNRVTVYRDGMEPEAVQIIEEELRSRGVGDTEILAHRMEAGRDNLLDETGLPRRCSFCQAPAVAA